MYRIKEYMDNIMQYQLPSLSITREDFYFTIDKKLKKRILNFYLTTKYLGINELLIKEKIARIKKRLGL